MLDRLKGPDPIIRPGEQVLLKVNNIGPYPPEQCATTHPAIVEAMIDWVFDRGGHPIVGDGPIALPQRKPFDVSGIAEVCSRRGVPLINFTSPETRFSEYAAVNARKERMFSLPAMLAVVDAIINLPKLKTHDLTLFTGGVKNMFGLTPFYSRMTFHRKYPGENEFSTMLADLYSLVEKKIRLCVMDAIQCMEGDGPIHGYPKSVGLIIAARDSVLVDALCAHIVGIGPARYSITRIMADQHGGQSELAEVVEAGRTASGFAGHSQFVLPSTTMKITGRFRQYLPKAVLKYRPIIQIDRCTRCRACVIHCPAQALSLVHDRVVLKSSRCIECYCCMEACETGALRIEGYLLNSRRIFYAVRRLKSWLMGKFMRNWFSVFGVQDRTIFPEH